ncbi:DUF2911 domain-containing protein [Flavivirga jejuensis]|uniref:DUF2911 domain-containing protein n=1 Tax=Flavivirga jejuensis TaxID=870487 RepID=UPI00349EEAF5
MKPLTTVENKIGSAQIKLIYSSPGVKERKVWNKLVPYNKIWRTGANDATVFETSTDVVINNIKLPRGKYSLFTIYCKSNYLKALMYIKAFFINKS